MKKTAQFDIIANVCFGLMLLAFAAVLLHVSWYKWPDDLVDYGRELYVPWQILNGKLLYRDIFYMFGPLAQYFNATLFWLFGVGLSTLVTFNICCVTGVCILLGYLQRRMFNWFSAWVSLFVFIGVFAFGQYWQVGNFNYICPYSHDALYGLELSILMFVCLWRVYDYPGFFRMTVLGTVMGLIFLTKLEIAVSAWIAAVTVLIMLVFQVSAFRQRSLLGAWLCGIIIPIVGFYFWFVWCEGPEFALHAIITNFSSPFVFSAVTKSVLYKAVSGLAQPAKNIKLLLLIGVLEFFLMGIALLLSRFSSPKKQFVGTMTGALIICVFFKYNLLFATELLRPLPIVLILFCLKWNFKKPLHTGFALFALLLLLKIILNIHAFDYGFLLSMPGAVLMIGWLVSHEHWPIRVLALMSIVCFVLSHLVLSHSVYESKDFQIGVGVDRFFTYNYKYSYSHGLVYAELIPWLKANIGLKESMVVIPEGVMINYLSQKENPCKLFEFAPNLVEGIGETRVLRLLQSTEPAYILITGRETAEYGARYFGKDFGQNIDEWINQQYEPVRVIGVEPLQGKGFGVKIYRKTVVSQRLVE